MIEAARSPVIAVMAARAVGSIAALMHIVTLVTGVTGAVTEIQKVFRPMAVGAGDTTVAAVQREAGHGKMIECQVGPRSRTVTIHALRSITSFVFVILLVTVDALCAGIGEIRSLVATNAICLEMRAG